MKLPNFVNLILESRIAEADFHGVCETSWLFSALVGIRKKN